MPAESFPFEEKDLASNNSLWELYQKWRSHHSVSREIEEQRKRFPVFKENAMFIHEKNNRKGRTFKLELNKFGDISLEEFQSGYAGFKMAAKKRRRARRINVTAVEAPPSVDWREQGAVTPVKDQGRCGFVLSLSMTPSVTHSLCASSPPSLWLSLSHTYTNTLRSPPLSHSRALFFITLSLSLLPSSVPLPPFSLLCLSISLTPPSVPPLSSPYVSPSLPPFSLPLSLSFSLAVSLSSPLISLSHCLSPSLSSSLSLPLPFFFPSLSLSLPLPPALLPPSPPVSFPLFLALSLFHFSLSPLSFPLPPSVPSLSHLCRTIRPFIYPSFYIYFFARPHCLSLSLSINIHINSHRTYTSPSQPFSPSPSSSSSSSLSLSPYISLSTSISLRASLPLCLHPINENTVLASNYL